MIRVEPQQLQEILDQEPDGIAVHGVDGRLLFVNAETTRALGYERAEDLVGKHVLDLVAPAERDVVSQRIERLLGGEVVAAADSLVLRRDGSYHRIEIEGSLIQYDGEPAIMLLLRDVESRDRRKLELITNDRLSSLGVLAAGIIHEMNNPLTFATLAVSQVLNQLRERPELSDLLARTEQAQQALDHMRSIAVGLRAFLRGDDEQSTAVDVIDLVEAALSMVSFKLAADVDIKRSYVRVPAVVASPNRLVQVFLNLMINAADALEEAGGRGELGLAVRADDDEVVVEISNSGPEIAAEARARIFEPFFTTKAVGAGTGLGLAIARELLEQFGATIELADGPVTRFVIRFPIARSREEP